MKDNTMKTTIEKLKKSVETIETSYFSFADQIKDIRFSLEDFEINFEDFEHEIDSLKEQLEDIEDKEFQKENSKLEPGFYWAKYFENDNWEIIEVENNKVNRFGYENPCETSDFYRIAYAQRITTFGK